MSEKQSKDSSDPKQSVGQTNGRTAALFRLNQYTTPALFTAALGVLGWLVLSVSANNFSRGDLQKLFGEVHDLDVRHTVDMKQVDERLDDMPPQAWQDRISRLETVVNQLGASVQQNLKENQAAHAEMLVLLGRLEEKTNK